MEAFQQRLVSAAVHVQDLEYKQRGYLALVAAALGGAYLRLFISRLSPGRGLLAVGPLLVLNCWLPLIFHIRDEIMTRAIWMLLLLWLANFKAIGLCLGRGPLVGSWTIPQTILLYLLPIYPKSGADGNKKGRLNDSAGTGRQMLMSFIKNTTCLVVACYMLTWDVPQLAKHYLHGFGLYGFVTFIMDGPAALLIAVLDMQVVPPFDKPWLSDSLADFWGRRWNNTVGLTLRALVYDPVVEGRLVYQPPEPLRAVADNQQAHARPDAPPAAATSTPVKHPHARTPMWLRFVGLCATFAVSGLMHELLLYMLCMPGEYVYGYWFTFFFIQAPLMALEGVAIHRLRAAGIKIPRAGAIGFTTFVLLTVAHFFWFPPVEEHSEIAQVIVSVINKASGELLKGLQQLPQRLDNLIAATIAPSS